MKINYDSTIEYDSNTKNEREWKLGDVIHDSNNPDSGFYLVSEVATDDDVFYTLTELESGRNLACTNTIAELQQVFYDKRDSILNGTFTYID